MGFFDDFAGGIKSVGEFVYDKGLKPVYNRAEGILNRVDKVNDSIVTAAGGVANGVAGLGDILAGNSSFFLYAGIAIVAILVLPKVLDKVL